VGIVADSTAPVFDTHDRVYFTGSGTIWAPVKPDDHTAIVAFNGEHLLVDVHRLTRVPDVAALRDALGLPDGDETPLPDLLDTVRQLVRDNAHLRAEAEPSHTEKARMVAEVRDKLGDFGAALAAEALDFPEPWPKYPPAPLGPLPYSADVDEVVRRSLLGPRAGELNREAP
jgi:hypothetical protein